MRVRNDGSVQSSNVPTYENAGRKTDALLYRCMVTKVIFTDDPNNITQKASNPRVLYDVVVLGGFASGQKISNCRLSSLLGGNLNYFERILRAATKPLSETRLQDQDGDIVFVQFVQGHSGYPVITALDEGIDTKTGNNTGATAADGTRLRTEFNGVFEEINKNGEWCFRRRGGKINSETGVFEPTTIDADPNFEAELKFTDNSMLWQDPNSSIEFLKNEKKWIHIVGKKESVYKEEIDGTAEKTTRTYKSGLKIEEDGASDKVTITTAGGAIIEIDGSGGKITLTKGSTIIELDGNGDKISLKGGFVDIGSSVSDFAVLFTELLTAFNTHTHNAPQAPAGVIPTTPPLAPMLQTVGSTTVKVQP